MKYIYIFIVALVFNNFLIGQNYVSHYNVSQRGSSVIIDYDLKILPGSDYYLVYVDIYDGGQKLQVTQLEGDLSISNRKVSGGRDKRIIWNAMEEPGFAGIDGNIEVKLNVKHFGKVLGGPESAIYSLLVPGLGDYKVREKKGPYYLFSIGAYGLVGGGSYMWLKSLRTYKQRDVSNTKDPDEIIRIKAQVEREEDIAYGLWIAGGITWLTDVTLVALKGAKNNSQRDQNRFSLRPNIKLSPITGQMNYGLTLNF